MTQEEFEYALYLHEQWINFEDDGVKLEFKEMDLRGLNFAGKRLDFAYFSRCDVRGVDFTNTSLKYTPFWGCDIEGAVFPDSDGLELFKCN